MRSNRAPKKIKAGTFGPLEGNLFIPFVVALFIGMCIFLALLKNLGILLSLFWGLSPFFLTLIYMSLLVFGKPPGYQFDYLRSKLGSGYLKKKKIKYKRGDLL